MARIPPIKRLSTEDFREQQGWIGKLLSPVNQFMETVTGALSKGLTFGDNLNAQVKDLDVSIPSAGSAFPIYYTSSLAGRPVALWVGNAVERAANPSPITSAVYVDWEFINGQIKINNISGLSASKKYRITLISIAG